MMTAQQLKNSILQRAIEGKLVEQRAEEGTAKELLKEIKLEKEKLVKEGKIKKSKPLPDITEEEIPFEIPESWKWVRLGEIFTTSSGTTPAKSNVNYYNSADYNWVRTTDLNNGVLKSCEIQISALAKEECYLEILPRYSVCIAMYGGSGTIGKNALIDFDTTINQSVFAIHSNGLCAMKYILYFIQNYRNKWMEFAAGSRKDPNINGNIIKNTLIPLPPLSEQHRIVAKIEELMPLVDQYDKAYSQLTVLNEKFPQDMKKSILQYAIEGKLVEQRSEEGTAKELLKEINLEKEKLIKEGKIKKSKPLPPITEDEIPFDIPDSWEWVRLGEIVTVCGGKRIPAGTQLTTKNTGHKYIRVSDMKNGTVLLDDIKFVTDDIYEKISRYTISVDDVYITVAGTIGSVGTIPSELNNANLTENADKLLIYQLNQKFMVHLLSSAVIQTQIKEATTKVGQPKLAIKRIEMLYIPLPPLSEQHRIVAKIEELMPLCDKLVKTK